ncbi:hypothetical protein ABGB19_25125 [Mycobacterium sp. B14F4]|uniref:hypothetical protein n=1 Tax=Mycobacterium sp. B14F4 TaxID=3153565 RepID=UPI00325EB530
MHDAVDQSPDRRCDYTRRFGPGTVGYSTGMQDYDGLPDDVPVADAIEQQRAATEPVFDEEVSAEPRDNPPLEAPPADWQEQLETVDLDPEEDVAED